MKSSYLVGALGATAVVLALVSVARAETALPAISVEHAATAPAPVPQPPSIQTAVQAAPATLNGTLPDPVKTPGAVRTTDRTEICTRKTSEIRNVPDKLKEAIRRDYGMKSKRDLWCNNEEACEIDHLIPLTIGGSNDQTNLWPQTFDRGVKWNAHVKDKLEVRLHKLVCKGGIDIVEAQQLVAKDWIAAYRKYVGSEPDGQDENARAD